MPGEKHSIRIRRNMSRLLSAAMVADSFLPMLAVVLAWRFLPDDLAFKLFLVSIAWFIISLLGFAVLRFSMTRSNQFTLLLDGPRLVLMKNDDILKEFNLDREHSLLVIVKELIDREVRFHERWVEVHISQGPERLSFRIYLFLGADMASPPGNEAGLRCAIDPRRVRGGMFSRLGLLLSHYEWEGRDTDKPSLDFLFALDLFSANNVFLPAIEKAKVGRMSISRLKRMML